MSELDAGSAVCGPAPRGLKQIYGEAPVAVESAKSYFLLQSRSYDFANRKRTIPMCGGDQLSVADILLMDVSRWAASCGNRSTGNLVALSQRVALRPAHQAGAQKNFVEYRLIVSE